MVVGYHHFRKPPNIHMCKHYTFANVQKSIIHFVRIPRDPKSSEVKCMILWASAIPISYTGTSEPCLKYTLLKPTARPLKIGRLPQKGNVWKCHFPTKSIFRCYLSDHTTQLYGDDFISHEIWIPMNHWLEPQTTNFYVFFFQQPFPM